VIAILAAAEWLHRGGAVAAWAWVCAAAGVAACGAAWLRPRTPRAVAAGLAALVLAIVVLAALIEVRRIECCWPARREARVIRASRALNTALGDAVVEAERLAAAGLAVGGRTRDEGFAAVEDVVDGRDAGAAERGVVTFDAASRPWVWSGRHRRLPVPDTAALSATITPFYATLEARRQSPEGATAVGSVLLAAEPAAADTAGALGNAVGRRHGVALKFYRAGAAPDTADVFDYTTPDGDTVLAVQPIPPGQGDAKLEALERAGRRTAVAVALAVLVLLLAGAPGAWRWAALAAGAWAAARAGPELAGLFSPATFYRPALGPFGKSAGALAVAGSVALIGAAVLWRRGLRRRPWSLPAAGLLVLATPYLLRDFARGIAPPATGVSFALWLSWQAAIALAAMALVLLAAALVRGRGEPQRVPWTVPAAGAWAAFAGLAGLWLWNPDSAWPEWYTFMWLPALVGVLVPAPRRWALGGVSVVAGTAAAVLTWSAALEGRLALAHRDAHRLGTEGDAMAVALLERLGVHATTQPAPRTAAALYALWLGSPLAAHDYPALLALWDRNGDRLAELRLAQLELPPALLAALARSTPQPAGVRVERLALVPGVHYVLVAPVATGELLTVGVGPRTFLLPPDRLARFLRGDAGLDPPYEISLSLPGVSGAIPPGPFWRRVGWSARGERLLDLPGGPRHVHVRVGLRGPWVLAVRGALVVLFDLGLVALAWGLGGLVAWGWRPRWRDAAGLLRASYRARLTAALIAFFVGPVLVFALWSLARLRDEARRAGDLLIGQTLRDAAVTAGPLPTDRPGALAEAAAELGQRLDADLWLYADGRLAGTYPPVLGELGLVDPLLDPTVFRRLTLDDELELTTDGRTAGRSIRVGYRVVAAGAGGRAVLAAPQLLDDQRVRRQQEDLVLVLLLSSLAGLAAAVYLAGLAARGLARPVAALRDAAVAVGGGSAPPPFPARTPREFTPVFTAFERMVRDVRRSQAALEEARQRTALVLANVATGVIAVDDGLRVTLANPRAAELLGATLDPGDELPRAAGPEWTPVWRAVADFIAGGSSAIAAREFDVDGRQIRAQLAPLGTRGDGCVVALDDTTAPARAARVLAWGEMARQVAHEIKNPLTPIRLGIQHLQRASRKGGRGRAAADFDATLDETAGRILAEIDRLDAIARAFSRFGAPGAEAPPLEPVDLLATAREVAQLYELGGAQRGAAVEVRGDGGLRVLARGDEVKEVLLNLLENARAAGARRVVLQVSDDGTRLAVEDDGSGIPAELLPRVFEPRFSTTSSGSGLGLAIARRLVESWGGTIAVESAVGRGTTVTVAFRAAEP
jgi:signal transduction histidine kinase